MENGTGAWFQGEKLDAFGAYWSIIEANYEQIVFAALTEAVEFTPSLARPDYRARAREDGVEMVRIVRRAVEEDDWPAVEATFHARGATFAKLGVGIDEWSDIVLLISRCSIPFVIDAHGRAPARLGVILSAMAEFWSRAIRVARAQYGRTREGIAAEQRDALRRSETRFARLFEADIVGICITEMGGPILEANDAFLGMLGYTHHDLNAGLRWDVLTPAESMAISARALDDLRRDGAAKVREKEYIHKNGHRVPALFGAALLDPDHAITFILDQSDARRAADALLRSEHLFRAVVETSPDAVSLLDRDGKFIYASPSAAGIAGRGQENLVGRSVFDLIAERELEVYKQRWQDCLDRPGVRLRHEFQLQVPDGAVRYAESIRTNHLDDPNLRAIVSLVRDVTDKRRLEEQFRQSQKLEAVGRLAGGVAHDFNNLLTVILGYCDLIAPSVRGAPAAADLEEIRRAGESAASLTKQLLAFSRKQVLSPQVINLSATVTEMDRMIRRLVGEHVELVTLPAEPLGNVRADPHQVEQVVMNLVVNARDSMPQGGKLVVETSEVEIDAPRGEGLGVPPGPYVKLSVSDSGAGMSPDVISRIFDPFFTTKGERGTGLGLATVFGIVRQSEGAIAVRSEAGRGTTFDVYFPRTTEIVRREPAVPAPSTLRGTETVLLVDDSEQVRALVHELLRRHGYHVLVASSPGEALLVAEQHPETIALLLTDVVMPKMTGRMLAERLVKMRPAIKVLYMSGYTEDAAVHDATLEPGMAFLPKPVTAATLLRKVRETLEA